MKQKRLKSIFKFALFCIIGALFFAPVIKADDGVSISKECSDAICGVSVNSLDNYFGVVNSNQYPYIAFNTSSQYGGQTAASNACSKYCSNCQTYKASTTSDLYYICKTYNLKKGYFATYKSNGSLDAITVNNETNFPKVTTTHKCQYVLYATESQVRSETLGNRPPVSEAVNFVPAQERYWVCEGKKDCEDSCSGACVGPNKKTNLNIYKLYRCVGSKLPNVFVNGVDADTLPMLTDADLKDWISKTGDGVAATLNGVLMVMNGEITCEGALGDAINIVKSIFVYIKIGTVAMLILFTTLDFMKSVTSGEKDLKTAVDKFIKRAIVVVVIFMLPTLINLILSIIQINDGLCGL